MRLPHPGSFLSLLLPGAGFAGEPFRGGPRRIPGVIEAEDFDMGDDGIAHHDLTEENHGDNGASGHVGDIDCLTFRRPKDAETMPRKP